MNGSSLLADSKSILSYIILHDISPKIVWVSTWRKLLFNNNMVSVSCTICKESEYEPKQKQIRIWPWSLTFTLFFLPRAWNQNTLGNYHLRFSYICIPLMSNTKGKINLILILSLLGSLTSHFEKQICLLCLRRICTHKKDSV